MPKLKSHREITLSRVTVVAVGIMMMYCEVLARGDLSGRFYLTYQDANSPGDRFESFSQHIESTLRDNVWGDNRLALTFFLDNSKNMQNDLTLRRYRGQVNMANPIYSLDLRFTPRQKITPLEITASQEVSNNQFSFALHAPKIPNVRVVYSDRNGYALDALTSQTRDLRADLNHRYRFMRVKLNRWNSRSGKSLEREVNVTGAGIRIDPRVNPSVTFSSSYDYQLTSNEFGLAKTDVTNHQINALLNARHKNIVQGLLTGSTRQLTSEGFRESSTRNDNLLARVALFPYAPATFSASRTYQATNAATLWRKLDYGSVEMLLHGRFHQSTTGRIHVATRWDIDSEGATVPPNTFLGAVRSRLYPGIDTRLEVNLAKRKERVLLLEPYQLSSILEFFLKPTRSLMLTPSLRTIGSGARVASIDTDRYTAGLRANYIAGGPVTLGADWRYSRTRTVVPRRDRSAVANVSVRLRSRSNVMASYGLTRSRFELVDARESRTRTFNVSGQVWLSQRGSFSVNYSNVERDFFVNSNLALSYRLDF